MPNDSYIQAHSNGGASFVGPDAVELYRAATLKSAIGLLQKGIAPTRGVTMKSALEMVAKYTGRTYKKTEAEQAKTDLAAWIETKRAAIPIKVEK